MNLVWFIPTGINTKVDLKPNVCNNCSQDICTYSAVKVASANATLILYYNLIQTHTHTHTNTNTNTHTLSFHIASFLKPNQTGSKLQFGKHLFEHTGAKAATL